MHSRFEDSQAPHIELTPLLTPELEVSHVIDLKFEMGGCLHFTLLLRHRAQAILDRTTLHQIYQHDDDIDDGKKRVVMDSLLVSFFASIPPRPPQLPSSAPRPPRPSAPGLAAPAGDMLGRCCLGEAG